MLTFSQLKWCLNFCRIHLNALQTRFCSWRFFFIEDNVTEEQSDLGPYCLQYKLKENINSKLQEHQQTREADEKRLNNYS